MCIAKRRLAGVLTIVSVCLNLPAHSANEPHIESIRHTDLQEKGGQIFTGGEPDEAIESQVDKRVNSFFSTLRIRLKLTEQQAHQIEPLVLSHLKTRLSILKENGISPDSRSAGERIEFRQLRAIKREMDSLDKQIESELVEILNDEQIEEYRLIQEERRAEIRSQIRSRVGR
jgi:hypothetical protein